MQAMITLADGSLARVNVYRDGDTVTVVGVAKHQTPAGVSETIVQSRMPVQTFEWYRSEAIKKIGSLAYSRLLGMAGAHDDIRKAPPLPPNLAGRYMLPGKR